MPEKSKAAGKIQEAKAILRTFGLPSAQQNKMSALTLLALCGVTPRSSWSQAKRTSLTVTKGIMAFIEAHYRQTYAPNTRETFRRQVLHQLVQARIVDYNPDDPSLPTNSPRAHYAVSERAFKAIRCYGSQDWDSAGRAFVRDQGTLTATYRDERTCAMVPVLLPDGQTVNLSPGEHNRLQAQLIEEFAPRFAPGSRLLYLGDTANKEVCIDISTLKELGIRMDAHGKLPDAVLLDARRNWLFLVEAVTSHGPMSPKRVVELKTLFSGCGFGLVFVTAFPDFAEFRRHIAEIAWETEVWIAEIPDHIIHYNGDRFLGPR